jgi:hypothetical protein
MQRDGAALWPPPTTHACQKAWEGGPAGGLRQHWHRRAGTYQHLHAAITVAASPVAWLWSSPWPSLSSWLAPVRVPISCCDSACVSAPVDWNLKALRGRRGVVSWSPRLDATAVAPSAGSATVPSITHQLVLAISSPKVQHGRHRRSRRSTRRWARSRRSDMSGRDGSGRN